MTPVMVMSDHLVLQALNIQAHSRIVGAASSVERAMRALEAPTLRPSATSAAGSHSSSPKFTSPHTTPEIVSAVVIPRNPRLTGGIGAWLSGAGVGGSLA